MASYRVRVEARGGRRYKAIVERLSRFDLPPSLVGATRDFRDAAGEFAAAGLARAAGADMARRIARANGETCEIEESSE